MSVTRYRHNIVGVMTDLSQALERGVMVSVVSIKGTNTSLEHIAKVANHTKGYNDILDPLKLSKGFNFILEVIYSRRDTS